MRLVDWLGSDHPACRYADPKVQTANATGYIVRTQAGAEHFFAHITPWHSLMYSTVSQLLDELGADLPVELPR